MDNKPPGIRRLCVAFATESSDGADVAGTEQRAVNAFTGVCTAFGLDRMLTDGFGAAARPRTSGNGGPRGLRPGLRSYS